MVCTAPSIFSEDNEQGDGSDTRLVFCLGTRAHCEMEFNSRLLDVEQDEMDEATDSDESVIAG